MIKTPTSLIKEALSFQLPFHKDFDVREPWKNAEDPWKVKVSHTGMEHMYFQQCNLEETVTLESSLQQNPLCGAGMIPTIALLWFAYENTGEETSACLGDSSL